MINKLMKILAAAWLAIAPPSTFATSLTATPLSFSYSVAFTKPVGHVGRMDFSTASDDWVMLNIMPMVGADMTLDTWMLGANYFEFGNYYGTGNVVIEYGIAFNGEKWLEDNCDQSTYFYSADPYIDICKTLFW